MEQINKQDVETDLFLAFSVLNHNYTDTVQPNDYSQITRMSKDPIDKFSRYMRRKDNVIANTGSGDLVLKCLTYRPKTIYTFDTSNFPKYFLDLKLAAAKVLPNEDLIKMFFAKDYDTNGSNELYPKFRKELSIRSQYFWDNILESYSWSQVYSSPLFTEDKRTDKEASRREILKQYSFLKPRNYRKLQENAKNTHVESFTCAFNELENNPNVFGFDYDLALLSDLPDQVLPENFIKNVKSLYIAPRGIVVASYRLSDDKYKYSDLLLESEGFTQKKADKNTRLLVKRY